MRKKHSGLQILIFRENSVSSPDALRLPTDLSELLFLCNLLLSLSSPYQYLYFNIRTNPAVFVYGVRLKNINGIVSSNPK